MQRRVLLGKIHRATITQTDINYNGSITIDEELYERANMHEYEKVEIFDIDNGNRFETYIIKGERNSGIIGINGAAARLVHYGDRIIIVNYGLMTEEEIQCHTPSIIVVDDNNKVIEG